MLDIVVTVGGILVLIALVALMLHLINTRQQQGITAADYEEFHPGNPPETPGGRAESSEDDRSGRARQEREDGEGHQG